MRLVFKLEVNKTKCKEVSYIKKYDALSGMRIQSRFRGWIATALNISYLRTKHKIASFVGVLPKHWLIKRLGSNCIFGWPSQIKKL